MWSIAFHILSYDVWFYASHIILHIPRVYGLIHYIHHATPIAELNYNSTHIAHSVENIIQPIGFFIPCFFIGVQPFAFVTSFVIIYTRGVMRHDHRFSWLIGNHHILHHKYPKYNFGEYWIDKMFGTLYPNKSEYIYGELYT